MTKLNDFYRFRPIEDHKRMTKQWFIRYIKSYEDIINEYAINPDKFVCPFSVVINGKRRKIITYRANMDGIKLRRVHRLLAVVIRSYYEPSCNSYAYMRGGCVKNALSEHLESDSFLKTDIHAYFDSVEYDKLEAVYIEKIVKNGFYKNVWIKALKTCFYESHLPIGFSSSPILSDLFLHDIDEKYSAIKEVKYTRYADDLIVSTAGENTKEKLIEIREQLEKDMNLLGLELNRKKTYIRMLSQEGDAIHLLGLNLVKRNNAINEITVSDRYIREVSKELCLLIAQKSDIEDVEARQRFSAVMGKIDYIKNASIQSENKLRKMVLIKSGVETDLSYKSLIKLCVNNPQFVCDYAVSKQKSIEQRIYPSHCIPSKGKVWVRFSSSPVSQPNLDDDIPVFPAYKGIKMKVMQLCRDAISQKNTSTNLLYLRLTIHGETKYYTGEAKQAESILEFSKRLSNCPYPISLFFEYQYDIGNPCYFSENKNHHFSPYGWCGNWKNGKTDVQNHVIISDYENQNWEFRRETSTNRYVQYNENLLAETDENIVEKHSEWIGKASLNLYWPLGTEQDLDTKIRKCIDDYKQIVNDKASHKNGIRSMNSIVSLHFSKEEMIELINKIRVLTSLITQSCGEVKLSAWMIPNDFLIMGSENTFDYVSITVSEGGTMRIRTCSL